MIMQKVIYEDGFETMKSLGIPPWVEPEPLYDMCNNFVGALYRWGTTPEDREKLEKEMEDE